MATLLNDLNYESMILTGLLYLFIFVQDQIPFKPKEEFEVKLNYAFKSRPAPDHPSFRFDSETKDRDNQNSSSILPYLILNLKVVKASSAEVRLKVVSNQDASVLAKKIKDGFEFPIDIGFTDDVKDRVTAHEYTVYFLDDDKKEQSKIVIFVEADGSFLVNGEIRGKL